MSYESVVMFEHITGAEQPVEAVIISGPRKGEIVTLLGTEPQISDVEARQLDVAVQAAKSAAEAATRLTGELSGLLDDLRRMRVQQA